VKRVLSYTVNGLGVGHVMRLLAINRWLRRLAAEREKELEQVFVTSSEAPELIYKENFGYFKVLSRSCGASVRIDPSRVSPASIASNLSVIKAFQPHLLIADTFPSGSFRELISARPYCTSAVLIYRPMKITHSSLSQIQEGFRLYDRILIPEKASSTPLNIPPEFSSRVRFIGPVMARERNEVMSRTQARDYLSIADDQTAVYVSAGGGGDRQAEAALTHILDTLKPFRSLVPIVAAGPLYKGATIYSDHIRWLSGTVSAEIMNGVDLAISASGYNSFSELIHFGVPTIFFAQERKADDQFSRAKKADAAGAAICIVDLFEANALSHAVSQMMNHEVRASIRTKALKLISHNFAREFAEECYRLIWPD
jgi:UDP-N-acetylglucosamine--N-acetylmuramyl-(pentapeptide) pyrophosphoryl-undecaprenol N-acetylglucosamine transferase